MISAGIQGIRKKEVAKKSSVGLAQVPTCADTQLSGGMGACDGGPVQRDVAKRRRRHGGFAG